MVAIHPSNGQRPVWEGYQIKIHLSICKRSHYRVKQFHKPTQKINGKVLIRQQSSGPASTQQAAAASSPLTPTPEEYVRSVKAAIAKVKTVEEDVKLQYMFFWLLAGCLFSTSFIVPDKLKKFKGRNEIAMGSLEANKKMLKENRSSLEALKKAHSDLEEEFKKIGASKSSPAPASQA